MKCQNHGHNQESIKDPPTILHLRRNLLVAISLALWWCPCELYQAFQTLAPRLEMCAEEVAQQMQTCGLASGGLALPH